MSRRIPTALGALVVAFLLAFPLLYAGGDYSYVMHLWITGFFYAILASSWALLAGYAGQFSFGHMAFMAIGAYATGLFSNYIYLTTAPTMLCTELRLGAHYLVILDPIGISNSAQNCLSAARATWTADVVVSQPPLWLGILLGIVLGGFIGFLIGALVLRLRAAYLALFTVGFSEILRAVLGAEIPITRGQAGLSLPPLFPNGITLFGISYTANDKLPPYYAMLLLLLACLAIMGLIARSRIGLFLRSLREDEEAAAALGVDTIRNKLLVFTVTAMIAAAAGAVEAHYIGIITPNILLLLQMSLVIAMAVIGGLENIVAAAIGGCVIEFALEALRTNISIAGWTIDMSVWRLVFFGLLLMLTLRFMRNGLVDTALLKLKRASTLRETVEKRLAAPSAAGGSETAP
jgi:branched-chain amino acid transport system permease protein